MRAALCLCAFSVIKPSFRSKFTLYRVDPKYKNTGNKQLRKLALVDAIKEYVDREVYSTLKEVREREDVEKEKLKEWVDTAYTQLKIKENGIMRPFKVGVVMRDVLLLLTRVFDICVSVTCLQNDGAKRMQRLFRHYQSTQKVHALLKTVWEKHWDADAKRYYYYNNRTGDWAVRTHRVPVCRLVYGCV